LAFAETSGNQFLNRAAAKCRARRRGDWISGGLVPRGYEWMISDASEVAQRAVPSELLSEGVDPDQSCPTN